MLENYLHSTESYFQFNRPGWLKYTVEYEDLEGVTLEEIENVLQKNKDIEIANNCVRRTNNKLFEEYSNEFLTEQKEAGAPVYGVRGGINAPYKTVLANLKPAFKVDRHPAEPNVHQFMYNGKEYRTGGTLFERFKRFMTSVERDIAIEKANDKLFVASVAYLLTVNVDVADKTKNDAIAIANNHAREAWEESNYPEGTVVDVDDNICECKSWTVGERRCSCGNRRISLAVEGDLLSGYYAYPEAY